MFYKLNKKKSKIMKTEEIKKVMENYLKELKVQDQEIENKTPQEEEDVEGLWRDLKFEFLNLILVNFKY